LIAGDTNVVLRLITADDAAQETIARQILQRSGVFVSLTVLMEAEWVLRSYYRWSRAQIADAFQAFYGLEGITIERLKWALWAVDRLRSGADFADMIHLLAVADVQTFATFDAQIEKVAGPDAPLPIETLA
jgi:predicted nucleic-acid-binding protein